MRRTIDELYVDYTYNSEDYEYSAEKYLLALKVLLFP